MDFGNEAMVARSLLNTTNSTAIHNSTTAQNSTLVATPHVGTLPTTTFIYIMTGSLVFLLSILPLITFFKTFKARANYAPVAGNDEKNQTPNFRHSQGPRPVYLESIARSAVEKNPLQPAPYVSPPIRNLPLPIGDAVVVQPDNGAGVMSIEDLYDTQELLAEKKRLEISIHNLKRVCGVPGRGVASDMAVMKRLNDASQRREQLVAAIDASLKKLKDQRNSWTDEEWSLIELIMQAYGRRI